MRQRPWWLLPVLAALLGAAGGHVSDSDADALERNRQRLHQLRSDPEAYGRLRRDLYDFHALPPERQQKLREVDARLHGADGARLWAALDRYEAWLGRLDEVTRRRVLDAPTAQARLAIIRELREAEWLAGLPKPVREALEKLPPEERQARIARMRAEERLVHREGKGPPKRALPAWMTPRSLREMPPEVQKFVKDYLGPALKDAGSAEEALKKAEGRWPEYPRELMKLTDRFLVTRPLPGHRPIAVMRELMQSREVKELKLPAGKKAQIMAGMKKLNGWPAVAEAFTLACRKEGVAPPALGACKPGHFPKPARDFLENKFLPNLPKAQRDALEKLEGRWPEYPRKLAELARLRRVSIPAITLPGPPEIWQAARDGE